MKRHSLHTKKLSFYLTILLLFSTSITLFAQYASIEYSTFVGAGSTERENITGVAVYNGCSYVSGVTESPGFPTTDGTTPSGGRDIFVIKYDANNNVVFSTVIGGTNNESIFYDHVFEVVDGVIHISLTSQSPDLPVTNGSSNSGSSDLVYFRLDATSGSILFGSYYGGSEFDNPIGSQFTNGAACFLISTSSDDFPTTNGSTSFTADGDLEDAFMLKLMPDGSVDYATYLGPWVDEDYEPSGALTVDPAGNAYTLVLQPTGDVDYYPVTDGTTENSASMSSFLTKLDPNGNVIYSNRIFYSDYFYDDIGEYPQLLWDSDRLFIVNLTYDGDLNFPSTDGSVESDAAFENQVIMNLNDMDASVNYLIYRPMFGVVADVRNACFYISGSTFVETSPVTINTNYGASQQAYLTKLSPDGQVVMGRYLATDVGNANTFLEGLEVLPNDNIFLLGRLTRGAFSFPTTQTPNAIATEDNNIFFTKFSADGSILNSQIISMGTFYSSGDYHLSEDNKLYIGNGTLISSQGYNYPVTDLSTPPASSSSVSNRNEQGHYQVVDLCPDFPTTPSVLMPATQTVCENGVVSQIIGEEVVVSGTDQPTLYRNGATPFQQVELEAKYQWQVATSPAGPWTDIPGAIEQNYSPQPLVQTRYYRRVATNGPCCGNEIISTSEVAEVVVGPNEAPVVEAAGPYHTCPGTPVDLDATVTGGAPGYTYDWDMGAVDIEDPTVNVNETTVFTLLVTDANGCQQIDQAVVNPWVADAGPATASVCDGAAVRIGGAPVPGVPGVTYSWSPTNDLSCTDCPNPLASPSSSTVYTLTLTIPVTSGGTCQTMDQITVMPVAPPAAADFAGPDIVVCKGDNGTVGLPAEAGFSYTWAPGNYLVDNMSSSTTFQPGNLNFPNPNPILYYLTAEKDGCTFVDEMEASVIEARAWIDGCGPRIVGEPDRTPNIDETYEWVKISGPGNFTGPTDIPVTTVSASVGSDTEYEVRVTYNGVTCTDRVIVPPACECNVDVEVDAPFVCPSFDLNGGRVTLTAMGASSPLIPADSYVFTWEVVSGPAGGLSSFTGNIVSLTDTFSRTLRVTLTSTADPNFSCVREIEINNPAWSLPVFSANDVMTCSNAPIAIGEPTVADYSYLWSPANGLSDTNISMPIATTAGTANYEAVVTDTRSGCVIKDTVTVNVIDEVADAGPDHLICDNGVITLGGIANYPNSTIEWSPANANWQNGTDENSAQPEVLVATNQTFTLTVTSNLGGCVSMDEVEVIVGTPVTPFTLPDVAYCPDAATPVALGSNVPAGMSYQWAPSSLLDDATAQMPNVVTPLPAQETTFSVTVTNAGGCEFKTTQTITPETSQPNAGSNKSICLGETTSIGSSSNPTGAGISYQWSGTGIADVANTTAESTTFTGNTAGTFTLTLTKTENGCTTSQEITILVNEFNLPAIPPVTICQNSVAQIGTTPVDGVQYFWNPSDNLSDATIAGPFVSGLTTSQTYTLTAIDLNGCSDVATVPVAVTALPAPTVTVPAVTACAGDMPMRFEPIVTPAAGSYTYQWSPNDGTLMTVNDEQPTANIQQEGVTTYALTVTDNNGCSTVAQAMLEVSVCPVTVSLGDTVWYDLNNDGIQDPSENGVEGVTVTLYDATTMMPVVGNDFNGAPIVPVMTDANGYYVFDDLFPGNYYVVFDPSTAVGGELLTFTTYHSSGSNMTNNSDVEDPTTGASDTTGTLTAGDHFPNLDAGLVCNVSAEAGIDQNTCTKSIFYLSQLNASMTPANVFTFKGTWTTSGTGTFDGIDFDGDPTTGDFATATTYTLSPEDITAGEVTFTLTTDDPAIPPFNSTLCNGAMDTVTITILNVDCGSFPWNGDKK